MAVEYRARSLGTALRYRGREGMWSWILHRLTGLGVLLFLIIHVVDTGIIIYRPDLYEDALGLYKNPVFRFAELLIFFSVLFHAANGLRIIVQDFRPTVMEHQRRLTWAAAVVVALAMLPVTWIMVAPLFGLAEEPGVERHRERCLENPEAPACLGADGLVLEGGE
jgi:succinate dehydrogenase / fumarate reductase, cytochrome b subunit